MGSQAFDPLTPHMGSAAAVACRHGAMGRSAAAPAAWVVPSGALHGLRGAEDSRVGGGIDRRWRCRGAGWAAEPERLIEELKADTAIAEADTLLLTVPNQLGVDYNAHVIEAILTHVAPALGWR